MVSLLEGIDTPVRRDVEAVRDIERSDVVGGFKVRKPIRRVRHDYTQLATACTVYGRHAVPFAAA